MGVVATVIVGITVIVGGNVERHHVFTFSSFKNWQFGCCTLNFTQLSLKPNPTFIFSDIVTSLKILKNYFKYTIIRNNIAGIYQADVIHVWI